MTNGIWQIELFGGLRLIQAERVITRFRTQKTAALLAYLALHIDRAHPRETLITLLWPDEPIEAGRNGLRVALNSLRKQLEPIGTPYRGVLFADRNQVRLNPDACLTDVSRFSALLHSDRDQRDAPSVDDLREAVSLYRGELLPGFYDDWVGLERERLSQIYHGSLILLARTFAERNSNDLALDYANRAVQVDPYNEEAYQILILAHANQGNISAAHQWHDRLVDLLEREFGTRPSDETGALMQRLTRKAPGEPNASQALPRASTVGATPQPKVEVLTPAPPREDPRGPLPYPFTEFFGRDDERADIVRQLTPRIGQSIRTLTLTGPGGTGKTRIAVEAARALLGAFAGSAIFVPLSDETSASRIAEAIAAAAGLPRSVTGDYWGAIVARLGERPTLLVLDGFEHLTAEGGNVVLALQKSAPELRVLVTSRRRLEIPGEREKVIAPLAIPKPTDSSEQIKASPSVRLFLDRAQAVTADFAATSRNSDDLAAVCRALEGIPLALELAAARTRSISLREMREQLTGPTAAANRFHLLTSRRADKPDRHRSLWATITWSVELLPPPLRQFFVRLSVFTGGWTLDAAQSVCEEPYAREYLTQLRSHSLIQSDEDTYPDQRFRMLDSLGEFASEQLSSEEHAALSLRHIDYFLGVADESRQRLRGNDQTTWLKRMDAEYDNLRKAIRWCASNVESSGESGLRFAASLGQYWQLHGPLRESATIVADLLLQTEGVGVSIMRAGALNTIAGLCLRLGDYEDAGRYFAEGLPMYRQLGDLTGAGRMLMNLGYLYWAQGDLQASYDARRESLAISVEVGDRWQTAAALLNVGSVERDMGDHRAAAASFEQSLVISREIGDPRGAGSALLNLANIAYSTGDLVRARAWYEESLVIAREQENAQGMALALSNIGSLLFDQENLNEAERYFTEALDLGRATGDAALSDSFYIELARIAMARGDLKSARKLLIDSMTQNLSHIKACVAIEAFGELSAKHDAMATSALFYGAAEVLRRHGGTPIQPHQQSAQDQMLEAIRAAVGAETFAEMWKAGQELTKEDAFDLARRTVLPAARR